MDAHKTYASDMETDGPAPPCGCTATEVGDDCVPCKLCERIVHQDEPAHAWGWDQLDGWGRWVRTYLCEDCYQQQPEVVEGIELEARIRMQA